MSTTVHDITSWLEKGKRNGSSHVIVATDWFDYTDYPIFVKQGDDPKEVNLNGNKATECYKLDIDWETQLSEFRAFHWEWDDSK